MDRPSSHEAVAARGRRALAFVALAVALLGGARARAEDRVDPDTQKHFDIANGLYREQRYADALVEYDAAYDRSHNWRILFNRGNCLVMLKREPEAIETFERYLHEGGDQIPEDRRTKVRQDIEALKLRLGSVSLEGAPDGAEIVLDGRVVAKTPLASPLPASAGTHDLSVRWSASVPGWSSEIRVIAGSPTVAHVVLAPPPGAPVLVPDTLQTPAKPNQDVGTTPLRRAGRAPGGLVAPAITISAQIGGSDPANDPNIGKAKLLATAEVAGGWRISPFFEIGAFYGGASGGYGIDPALAAANNVDPNADYAYRTYGLRARMHLARGASYDGWFGVDLGRYTETWDLTGLNLKGNFHRFASSGLFALAIGADFPFGRAFAIGGSLRYLACSASGSQDAGSAEPGAPGYVFSGGYASTRGFFELGLHMVWSIPFGPTAAPTPAPPPPAASPTGLAALPPAGTF